MKYRILSMEELAVFAEDFKQFLIVNGVHHEEWVEMNNSDKPKAVSLIEVFSDSVLQKVYEKIQFVELRTVESCMVFKLNKTEIELISVNVTKGSKISLETPDSVHGALSNNADELTIFKTRKNYNKERELEIHEMIQQGCEQSSELFWKSLEKIL